MNNLENNNKDKKENVDTVYNNRHFTIKEKTILVAKEYNVYLHGHIEDDRVYTELMDLLNSVSEHDSINLYISSYGGSIQTTELLLNSINSCRAKVTGIGTGMLASAATILLLGCPCIEIEWHTTMMLHSYSSFSYGKRNESKTRMLSTEKRWELLVEMYYKGFLTDDEIKRLEADQDFYFSAEEIGERLTNRLSHLEKLKKESEKEQEVEEKKKTKKTTKSKSNKAKTNSKKTKKK
jgi:ATP-dependent protease ClpP protease subunit